MSEVNHNLSEKTGKNRRADAAAMIFCFFAAFCLWIYVMSVESPEHEQTFSHITVELSGADELAEKNLGIYNGYGTMIDVTLSGKKSVVSKLTEKDIVATADVSTIGSSGRFSSRVTVDVPAGCKLVGMSQDTISVYADQASQITVELTEQRENTNLPEGCYTGPIDFPVDMITVSGPVKVLNTVAKAVVSLDLSGVTRSTPLTQKIFLADQNGNRVESPYLDYYPKEVTVNVPVIKKVTVPVETCFKYGFLNEKNTAVTVTPAEVEITGDPDVIDRGGLIQPIVLDEKQEFADGECRKSVLLETAADVTMSVNRVDVAAKLADSLKTREITVPGENIEDTGAKEGVNYTWERSNTVVTVLGKIDAIASLEPEDITLQLDMSPYSDTNTGTIQVKAEVVIDSPYRDGIIELGSYEINVTFSD